MKEVFVKDQVICVTGISYQHIRGGGDGGKGGGGGGGGEKVVFFRNFIRE